MHYRIKHGSVKIGQRFAATGEVVALSPMDAGQFADVLEDVEPHAGPDEASDRKLTEHEQKLATPTPPPRKRRKEVKP